MRALHSFRAIAASQGCSSRGAEPRSTALYADRKTCCAASSASTGSRSKRRQSPSTMRPCSVKSLATRAPAAPLSERPAEGEGFELLAVSVAAVISVIVVPLVLTVVVVLIFSLVVVVLVLVLGVLCLPESEIEGHELAYDRG